MSKINRRTKSQKKNAPESFFSKFNIEEFIPNKYQTIAAIVVILILFLIYFAPMFFGNKTFQSGDLLTSMSFKNYVDKNSEHLWNPYIFCGMPSAMSFGPDRWYDLSVKAYHLIRALYSSFFAVSYASVTFYLLVLALSMFFLMRSLRANVWVSLFTALAASFSTGIIVFIFIGHVTQIAVLAIYPLVFLFLFKFQKGIKLLDIILLIIAIHFLFEPLHVQIIFYTFFSVGVYFVYFLIHYFMKKDYNQFKRILLSVGVFIIAVVIALLMSYDKYMQTYEYTPYSTRGAKSVLEESKSQKSESDFYQYATSWSFSPGEILTSVVPSYFGFGNSIYNGPLTDNQDVKVNTYFGQMPFVDVAVGYMGVIIFFLGLFSIYINWDNHFVRYLTLLIIISLLISFGKTFSPVFDLMFYYFPLFDKFRVPSMILVLIQVSFPILAGLGLMKILSFKNEKNLKYKNFIKNITIVFASILVITFLFGGPISDWFKERIAESGSRGQQLKPIYDYMANMFLGDLHIAFLLLTLTFGLIFLFINQKVSADTLVILIIVFTIFDLWRIDMRGGEYTDNPEVKNIFNKPEYVKEIEQKNNNSPFRLLNIKQDGNPGSFNSNQNYYVYFLLEDFYGYSAIKPRTYQDLMDVIGPVNNTMWRMLNVKYVISSKPTGLPGLKVIDQNSDNTLSLNEYALPRAYFVDSVKNANALELLNLVKNNSFDPKNVAYLENENISIDKPDSSAYTRIDTYKDEQIDIEAKSTGNNFLFLGDTYYPLGWKALIDGKDTRIYKANHGFMGIVVPKGNHKVEFLYAPHSFYLGKYISLTLNIILILLLLLLIWKNHNHKKETMFS